MQIRLLRHSRNSTPHVLVMRATTQQLQQLGAHAAVRSVGSELGAAGL
jgi:hypothetical protein